MSDNRRDSMQSAFNKWNGCRRWSWSWCVCLLPQHKVKPRLMQSFNLLVLIIYLLFGKNIQQKSNGNNTHGWRDWVWYEKSEGEPDSIWNDSCRRLKTHQRDRWNGTRLINVYIMSRGQKLVGGELTATGRILDWTLQISHLFFVTPLLQIWTLRIVHPSHITGGMTFVRMMWALNFILSLQILELDG